MLNLDSFVEDCRAAVQQDQTHLAVSEIMEGAFADPAAVTAGLGGTPTESEIVPIYKSGDLTIINVIWKPGMTIMPHNDETWAVIEFMADAKTTSSGVGSKTPPRAGSRGLAPRRSPPAMSPCSAAISFIP